MIKHSSVKKLNYGIKFIPLLIFLFLLINFVFNAGYFFIPGGKILSLLTLNDYYEGSAPLVSIAIISFAILFDAIFFNYQVRTSYRYFHLIYTSKIYIPLRIFKLKIKDYFYFKKNYSKCKYKDKKVYIERKKYYTKIKSDTEKAIKSIEEFKSFSIFVLFFTVLFPVFIVFLNCFFVSKRLFCILIALHICVVITSVKKNSLVKNYLLTVFFVGIIFSLGVWKFLNDYIYDDVSYVANNREEIYAIRPISKGILAKRQKEIIFIDWNGNIVFQSKVQNLINFFMTTSDIEARKQYVEVIEKIYKKYKNKNNKIDTKTQNHDKKTATITSKKTISVVNKDADNAK